MNTPMIHHTASNQVLEQFREILKREICYLSDAGDVMISADYLKLIGLLRTEVQVPFLAYGPVADKAYGLVRVNEKTTTWIMRLYHLLTFRCGDFLPEATKHMVASLLPCTGDTARDSDLQERTVRDTAKVEDWFKANRWAVVVILINQLSEVDLKEIRDEAEEWTAQSTGTN